MIIENFEEKGLSLLGAELENGRIEGYYASENEDFVISVSIWNPDKWVIIPATPEVFMKINCERFEGNEEEVLKKLKKWHSI